MTTTSTAKLATALLALILIGLVGPTGCDRGQTWDNPGPKATYQDFLMHWFKNDRSGAFEMIAAEDRRVLEEPRDELAEHMEREDLPEPGQMLVAGRVDNPYDIKSIEVKPKLESKPDEGDRVTLELTYQDGRSGEATMVWQGDGWYVDLPLEGGGNDGSQTDDSPSTKGEEEGRPDAGSGSTMRDVRTDVNSGAQRE